MIMQTLQLQRIATDKYVNIDIDIIVVTWIQESFARENFPLFKNLK